MLGINSIIGAGIFLTPGEVIGLAGPFAPMAYVLAGIFAGVVAIVFATAARYVRTNGASYAYTTAAFGRRIGIYVGVTHAITASIAWGVLASFFVSTLLRVAFPDKAWADAEQLFSVKTLTFLGFIGVLLAINLFGNRAIKWANGTSTVGKAFALSAFIVGGLWIITTQHVNNYATAWSAYSATPYLVAWRRRNWQGHVLEYGAGHDCRVVRIHRFRIDRERRRRNGRAGPEPAESYTDRDLLGWRDLLAHPNGSDAARIEQDRRVGRHRETGRGHRKRYLPNDHRRRSPDIDVRHQCRGLVRCTAALDRVSGQRGSADTLVTQEPIRRADGLLRNYGVVGARIPVGAAVRQPAPDRPGGDRPIRPVHHRADRSHRIGEVSGSRTCCCAAKCVHRQGVTACCDRGLGWAGSVLRLPLHLSSAGWSELLLDCFDRDHVHRGTGDGLSALLPNHSPGWRSAEHSLDSVGAELERENTTASDGGNSLVGAGKISTCIPGSAARASVCNAEGL
ncbi:permease [Mycobacterium tuberculosis RGTB327]|nr:permease [Mycobacterium tuberculosis RGTB327]